MPPTPSSRPGTVSSLLLALILIFVSLSGGVWWHLSELEQARQAQAGAVVTVAARQIGTLIEDQRRSVRVFAEDRSELLAQLTQVPSDKVGKQRLTDDIRRHFPRFVGHAITTSWGEPLPILATDQIGKRCRADLKRFAAHPDRHAQYVHRMPDGRMHYDTMVKWVSDTDDGLLFISHDATRLVELLDTHHTPGLHLLLLDSGEPNMLDLAERAASTRYPSKKALYPEVVARILAQAGVSDTRWIVAALPDTKWGFGIRMRAYRIAASAGVALFAAAAFWLYRSQRKT